MQMSLSILFVLLFSLAGYLAGSIPTAVLLARSRGIDITKVGSGNPGGTNVWRALGKRAGLTCMGLDFLKGFLPAFLTFLLTSYIPFFSDPSQISTMDFMGYSHINLYVVFAGVSSMLGHAYPIFFRFKGGKNVMVTCGFIGATAPLMMGIALAVFLLFAKLSKKVSVGSLAAAATVFLYSLVLVALSLSLPSVNQGYIAGGWHFGSKYFLTDWAYGLSLILASLFVVFRHRSNIAKLLRHEEKNFDPNANPTEGPDR